jgi:hypothetical protein
MPYKDPEARKAYAREYHQKHKAKQNERSRQWRLDNSDKVKDYKHQYYLDNRDKHLEKASKWAAANPGKRYLIWLKNYRKQMS